MILIRNEERHQAWFYKLELRWTHHVSDKKFKMMASPLSPHDVTGQLTTFRSYVALIADPTPGIVEKKLKAAQELSENFEGFFGRTSSENVFGKSLETAAISSLK
uniref:Uncharacterized protein n=1 Tax=Magallana gigas TaxID=29159 RepID=K1PMD0_MAGGI